MSVLLDALMNREPLEHTLAREGREVDAEFRRRWNEAHRYDHINEPKTPAAPVQLREVQKS